MIHSNSLELVWLLFKLIVMVSFSVAIAAALISRLRIWFAKADLKKAIRRDMIRARKLDWLHPR